MVRGEDGRDAGRKLNPLRAVGERMETQYPSLKIDEPAAYRILVQGWVSDRWEEWLERMNLTHPGSVPEDVSGGGAAPGESGPAVTTLLTGVLPDQAALLGTLQRLYAFGLPILRVELVI